MDIYFIQKQYSICILQAILDTDFPNLCILPFYSF